VARCAAREKVCYEITSVPFAVRDRDMQMDFGEQVLQRYGLVCFDKEDVNKWLSSVWKPKISSCSREISQ
jgi:hypothetical protein